MSNIFAWDPNFKFVLVCPPPHKCFYVYGKSFAWLIAKHAVAMTISCSDFNEESMPLWCGNVTWFNSRILVYFRSSCVAVFMMCFIPVCIEVFPSYINVVLVVTAYYLFALMCSISASQCMVALSKCWCYNHCCIKTLAIHACSCQIAELIFKSQIYLQHFALCISSVLGTMFL